jgi:hypothetical protein
MLCYSHTIVYEFLELPPFPSCETLNLDRCVFILLFSLRRCFRNFVGKRTSGQYVCMHS